MIKHPQNRVAIVLVALHRSVQQDFAISNKSTKIQLYSQLKRCDVDVHYRSNTRSC